jgi:YidC/Oxa1 family membrane protein insertase
VDRNVLLAFALSTAVFLGWLVLQSGRQRALPHPSPTEVAEPQQSPTEGAGSAPPAPEPAPVQPAPAAELSPEPTVPTWTRTYDQGLYHVTLSNRGGTIQAWTLSEYDIRSDDGAVPVELVQVDPSIGGVLQTPFPELGLGDLGEALFQVEDERPDGASFALQRGGITVRKTYTFERDSYGFQLVVEVVNESEHDVSSRFQISWPAEAREGQDFRQQSLAAYREGSVKREPVQSIGKPGFFGTVLRGGRVPEVTTLAGDVDWSGVDNRYFLSVLLPDRAADAQVTFEPLEPGKAGAALLAFNDTQLPPGQSLRHEYRGYIGPKEPARLDAVSESLEHSINRGWSWVSPLTRFFEWMLKACYSVVPNYGLAIIILTVLVRLITMPIMNKQMKSMERMRTVQPMLKELQEKYADDRQKQSEEMMKLYRREGVNPLGGCLPMLLQFPVFIGLFYALQSSIALRHAGFVGWIDDLSAPESLFLIPGLGIPFRVLPLVMGGSMVLQQKFTPTTVDPAQARMMMTIMPIMFTVLFYRFPSGLVLYWMVSNFLGIANQLWVRRRMDAG